MYKIVWKFESKEAHRGEFEMAYGSNGCWVRLFKQAEGYLGTELLRNSAEDFSYYITIDTWRSKKDFENFKAEQEYEYKAIDKRMENLTSSEELIGTFDLVETSEGSG